MGELIEFKDHSAVYWIQNTAHIESTAWWSYLNSKLGKALLNPNHGATESKTRCILLNPKHGAVKWIQTMEQLIESKTQCILDQQHGEAIWILKHRVALLNPNHGAIETKTQCSLLNPNHGAIYWIQTMGQLLNPKHGAIDPVAWWSYLNPKLWVAIESKPRCYWIQNTVQFMESKTWCRLLNPKHGANWISSLVKLFESKARRSYWIQTTVLLNPKHGVI